MSDGSMGQGIGDPLEDLLPLVGGSTDMTDQGGADFVTLGCHKGDFRGLNVRNPDPNFVYQWINDRPSEIQAARMKGRILVGPEDQEASAVMDLLGFESTPLDGAAMFHGMRLCKTPIEIERRHQAQRDRLHRATFHDGPAERKYLNGMTDEEHRLGGERGLRLMRADHGSRMTEGPDPEGRSLATWRPQLGLDYQRS